MENTKQQAEHLDLILKTLIKDEKKFWIDKGIQKNILPNENLEYCNILLQKLNEYYPQLIKSEKLSGGRLGYRPTGYVKVFLYDGGFVGKDKKMLQNQSLPDFDKYLPTNIPSIVQTNPNKNISLDIKGKIFNHVVEIIIGIVVTLIGGFILFKLGWL